MGASLSQKGVEFDERDFFKTPFTEDELRGLLGDRPPSDMFSWRSPSFRKMDLDRDSLSDDDLVRLMLEEPRLIRRPFLKVGDELIIAADCMAWINQLDAG